MRGGLALWHSARANEAAFADLARELAPDVPVAHHVRLGPLDAAQAAGLTPAIRREVALDILRLADAGASVVLCTCSTLGPGAESASELTDAAVLRVDRPMVERALDLGRRVLVAAALPSTLGPTRELLLRAARERGVTPEVEEVLVADAWPLYAAGDRDGYAARIAGALRGRLAGVDAVVLAQASMAPAAGLLADAGAPVLASPRLGFEAAVAAWRARGG